MAGNLTALASGSEATSWNPAGLLWLDRREVSFSYSDLFGLGLVTHTVAQFGWPQLEKDLEWDSEGIRTIVHPPPALRAVGLLVSNLRAEAGDVSYRETEIGLAYAWRMPDLFHAGLSVRFLWAQSDSDEISASGQSINLGLQRPVGPFWLGLHMKNLASSLDWETGSDDPLPERWDLALAWKPTTLPLAATIETRFIGGAFTSSGFGGGIEWHAVGPLTLRGGVTQQDGPVGTETDYGSGFGFLWNGLSIDYGFLVNGSDLGTTHRWSAALDI